MRPTSHPLFNKNKSDQEFNDLSQWKSSGPNEAPGNYSKLKTKTNLYNEIITFSMIKI
jgi:hypothetical protein